jgi:hypothetical protein
MADRRERGKKLKGRIVKKKTISDAEYNSKKSEKGRWKNNIRNNYNK